MQQFTNTHGTLLVISRHEEVISQLNAYAKQHNLASAWVSGLGGAATAELGFYDIKSQQYQWHSYDQPMEILNLTGNLAWVDGEPFWHLHGSFSGDDLQSIGGHVKSLTIGLTCELLITPLDTPLTRNYDADTGLKLLSGASD